MINRSHSAIRQEQPVAPQANGAIEAARLLNEQSFSAARGLELQNDKVRISVSAQSAKGGCRLHFTILSREQGGGADLANLKIAVAPIGERERHYEVALTQEVSDAAAGWTPVIQDGFDIRLVVNAQLRE